MHVVSFNVAYNMYYLGAISTLNRHANPHNSRWLLSYFEDDTLRKMNVLYIAKQAIVVQENVQLSQTVNFINNYK